MDKCLVRGQPIIKFEDVRENGYLNAVPWIEVCYFKVDKDDDKVLVKVQVCGSKCLSRYANSTAGTLEPV